MSTTDGPYSQGYDYDQWGNLTHKYGWGGEVQGGTAWQSSDIWYGYTNNRRNGLYYDASGNLTNDIGQAFTYDATGQQTASSYTNLQNFYDGDGLRVERIEDGLNPALFLRSTVLGGQIVAEIDYISGSWQWQRGYVYQGSQLLAVQQSGAVYWMHEDPVTKSKRVTDASGNVVSTVELDPWGADTPRSSNAAFQPKKFTGVTNAMRMAAMKQCSAATIAGTHVLTNPTSDAAVVLDPTALQKNCQSKSDLPMTRTAR